MSEQLLIRAFQTGGRWARFAPFPLFTHDSGSNQKSHCLRCRCWQYGRVNFPGQIGGRDSHCSGSRRGFSLIELLIVMVIILILASMLYSSGSRSRQDKDKAACERNLQKIYLALDIHSKENNGAMPFVAGAQTSEAPLSQLVPRFTVASEAFICPGSGDTPLANGEPFANRRISYAYFMGRRSTDPGGLLMSDRQINTQPKAVGELVFSEDGKAPGNNHHKYGGVYLLLDGRTEAGGRAAEFAVIWPTNVTLLNPKP
jgi:prepilin-type N-terminal cleavage/methylation domain-containing protein